MILATVIAVFIKVRNSNCGNCSKQSIFFHLTKMTTTVPRSDNSFHFRKLIAIIVCVLLIAVSGDLLVCLSVHPASCGQFLWQELLIIFHPSSSLSFQTLDFYSPLLKMFPVSKAVYKLQRHYFKCSWLSSVNGLDKSSCTTEI